MKGIRKKVREENYDLILWYNLPGYVDLNMEAIDDWARIRYDMINKCDTHWNCKHINRLPTQSCFIFLLLCFSLAFFVCLSVCVPDCLVPVCLSFSLSLYLFLPLSVYFSVFLSASLMNKMKLLSLSLFLCVNSCAPRQSLSLKVWNENSSVVFSDSLCLCFSKMNMTILQSIST